MSANSSYPTFITSEAPALSNDAPKPPKDSSTPTTTTDPQRETADSHAKGDTDATGSTSEAQQAADRLYEERIEEEYAKREGGA
jgi:hypothetical protein